MKKLYTLGFIIFSFCSLAQSWCPAGATWHYREYSSLGGFEAIHEYKYVKDTLINATTCKQIVETKTAVTIAGIYVGTPSPNPFAIKYYTYENNHVVYLYNGSSFDTLVNYNASVGDKWLRLVNGGSSGGSSKKVVTVTGVGQMNANGTNLKKITTAYTYTGSFSSGTSTEDLVEKIGNVVNNNYTTNILFPFYYGLGNFSDYSQITFLCYKDNSFPVYTYVPNLGCLSTLGIEGSFIENSGYEIWPNPARDFINVKRDGTHEKAELILSDFSGREIEGLNVSGNTTLDLKSLNKGIYFLQLRENGRLLGTKKVIKE